MSSEFCELTKNRDGVGGRVFPASVACVAHEHPRVLHLWARHQQELTVLPKADAAAKSLLREFIYWSAILKCTHNTFGFLSTII